MCILFTVLLLQILALITQNRIILLNRCCPLADNKELQVLPVRNSFCLTKIWWVNWEFQLLLIETNNKNHYPGNDFSTDLNTYVKEMRHDIRVTVTLGHESCDCLLGGSKVWLNIEVQTWTGFGCVETYSSTDAYCSQAAALLWLSQKLRALWRSKLMEAGPDFTDGKKKKKERKYTKQSLSPKNCKNSPENVISISGT